MKCQNVPEGGGGRRGEFDSFFFWEGGGERGVTVMGGSDEGYSLDEGLGGGAGWGTVVYETEAPFALSPGRRDF